MTANQKWAIVSLGMSSAGVALLWVAGGWAAAVGGFLIYGSLNVSWSIGRDRERAWTESRLLEGPSEAVPADDFADDVVPCDISRDGVWCKENMSLSALDATWCGDVVVMDGRRYVVRRKEFAFSRDGGLIARIDLASMLLDSP